MPEELKQYEQTIKTKHSIGWTPKYEEKFQTQLNNVLLLAIAAQTFEKLGWISFFRMIRRSRLNAETDGILTPKKSLSLTIAGMQR